MFFIYGLGKSGISVIKYFNNQKINFHCWDDELVTRKEVKKYRKHFQQDKNALWLRDVVAKDLKSKGTSHPSTEGCITLRDIIYDSVNR